MNFRVCVFETIVQGVDYEYRRRRKRKESLFLFRPTMTVWAAAGEKNEQKTRLTSLSEIKKKRRRFARRRISFLAFFRSLLCLSISDFDQGERV